MSPIVLRAAGMFAKEANLLAKSGPKTWQKGHPSPKMVTVVFDANNQFTDTTQVPKDKLLSLKRISWRIQLQTGVSVKFKPDPKL